MAAPDKGRVRETRRRLRAIFPFALGTLLLGFVIMLAGWVAAGSVVVTIGAIGTYGILAWTSRPPG